MHTHAANAAQSKKTMRFVRGDKRTIRSHMLPPTSTRTKKAVHIGTSSSTSAQTSSSGLLDMLADVVCPSATSSHSRVAALLRARPVADRRNGALKPRSSV
jgi:hypothetical protein